MGLNGSRVIQIKNINQHLNQCQILGERNCPIYGQLQLVRYKGMDFNIASSQTDSPPHPNSIHYLVVPRILLFPDFELLEDISPSSLQQLLDIIKGVSQMAIEGGQIGIGRKRVAFKDRWGVVGQLQTNWTYQQVFVEGITEGVYFSPQQMIALSQNRQNPNYNTSKADIFALGIMLMEVIFGEDLEYIYDYHNFEIKLNPVLQKLQRIKEQFGENVANMFISMLEIEEDDRTSFEELLMMVNEIANPPQRNGPGVYMLSSNSSQRNIDQSRGNRTPGKNQAANPYINRTPKAADKGKYRNDVSPFRGRFGGAVKGNVSTAPTSTGLRKTPERAVGSRSPMRRNLQLNTRNDRQTFGGKTMATPKDIDFQGMRGVSPLGRR